MHDHAIDTIERACMAAHGTEYDRWPPHDFADYAEHKMLALVAMTDEQLAARFFNEADPRAARDEDLAYWASVVARRA